jgi:hypothetical protein
MANEFQHKDPGTALTQAEFIASDGTGHIFDGQAAGDVLYASSTTVLKNLAKATDGNVLELASGLPAWTASPTIGSTSWANANHAHAASNSGGTLTTLGTVTTGVWQGTVVAAAYLPDAAADAQGVAELATTAEIDTGDDTGRVITPKALADSNFGERVIQMVVVGFTANLTVQASGAFWFHVPSTLDGFNIVDVHAEVITVATGSTIIIDLYNVTQSGDILSTNLTIDASESGSDTAATAAVIDTGEDLLATNDVIRVDIDQIGSSNPGVGLIVTMICRLP